MTWTGWGGRVGVLLLVAGIASAAELTAQVPPRQAVRVLIRDYARLSPSTLVQAEWTASYVLRQAGVLLEWAECRIHEGDPPKDPACGLAVTAMDLQLQIIDAAMAKHTGKTGQCLGYAVVTGRLDSIASVFAHRALELEKRNFADRAAILGAIIAHEIGHLLLGRSRHSGSGIMRAQWGDEDLKLIAKGRMWFTEEEASRLVSNVAKRQHAQNVAVW
jgi:hypothetical protein